MAYAPVFLTLAADQPRLSRLVCFVAGCLTTLGFEPFGLSIVIPILLLPVLFLWMSIAPRDSAGHTFWYGLGLFLTGTYWIYISVVVFGEAPTWVALLLMVGLSVIMAFYLFLAGWIIGRLTQGEPLQLLAIAPAVWVLVEWLRGWILTGFPWMAFGYANVDSAFAGYAPVAGVYGVSFAVMLTASALLATLMTNGILRIVSFGLVFLPWIIGGALTLVDWTEEAGEPIRTTILQAGVPQNKKWLPEYRQPTLNFYRDSTRIARESEIVVWPEVAIPSLSSREAGFISQLQSDARENNQTILFGILEDVEHRGESVIYNSVFALDGSRRQVYRKRHLVPFGEYFPVPAKAREWLRMMSLPHTDLTEGERYPALIETLGGVRLAVAICYEDAFGSEQLYALPDARILINVSNDGWFGDSIAPHQHLQIARMRSLEFGRPTVRATNTGISAFISHEGELLGTTPQFQEAKLSMDVTPRKGSTPYANFGNAPVLILSFLILGVFWLRAR